MNRAEQDHIQDYNDWASGEGKELAQRVENKLKEYFFGSLAECEATAEATMWNTLGTSFSEAIDNSINEHDKTGRHGWGGPNARP